MKKKEIRIRCWVDIDGVKFIGPGRIELLSLIGETGSISKAARQMGMSYKKAWDMITELNARGSKQYVITAKGGSRGGGAELTDRARQAMTAYSKLMKRINRVVESDSALLKAI